MNDFPVCSPSTPPLQCCVESVPNTSQWQVVCPGGADAVPPVPAVSTLGLLLCAVMVGAAAVAMIRGPR